MRIPKIIRTLAAPVFTGAMQPHPPECGNAISAAVPDQDAGLIE
jgi:hypothetical protein